LGVVYNRYPFPSPPSPAKNDSSCKLGQAGQPKSLTFWEASSQIRLARPLVTAAADLYDRHVHVLWQKAAEKHLKPNYSVQEGKAMCIHWRRTDFKTYGHDCLTRLFCFYFKPEEFTQPKLLFPFVYFVA
jgi:hypothetical protein